MLKNWQTILLCVCVAVLLVWLGRSCNRSDDYKPDLQPAVAKVEKEKEKREAIKKEIPKADTGQKKAVKRWQTIKTRVQTDTVYKHDTIIQTLIVTCDSALSAKDSLIQVYKTLARQDSSLISSMDTLTKHQEKTIYDLTKSVKKEKRKRKFWKAVTIIAAGVLTGIYISK